MTTIPLTTHEARVLAVLQRAKLPAQLRKLLPAFDDRQRAMRLVSWGVIPKVEIIEGTLRRHQ